jgi:hypothetical protein
MLTRADSGTAEGETAAAPAEGESKPKSKK